MASRLLILLAVGSLCGQESPSGPAAADLPASPLASATFGGLRFRSIGPALMSGRISAIAVHPHEPATWYVGVASGGVWKTANAGTTWTPIFQNEGSYSIGVVILDPRNPSTVWIGTGENNNQRSVGWGDGVYRSDDGGKSWRNVGLKQSEHIAKILIDPRDSNTVYVASQGPLWGPGGERGLYKTTDGGKTWTRILSISDHTGVTDVVMDPNDPDTLLAAAHQRRRHVWTLIHGGPESGLHKSNDGGKTWRKIRSGMPSGDLGRIGLAYSPAQKGLVYATIEAGERRSGTYRSTDGGESWEKRSDVLGQPMYYSVVAPDPNAANTVYMMDVVVQVSDDGGRTWRVVGERSKHVDNHVYWIDPKNSNHILAGCDGGLYESWDRGQIWKHFTNLSVTQFYNVAVDNAAPIYNVYGGTQDNSTLGGPSRTRGTDGATNADWFIVTGGDGFVARIDPSDPNIVYGESQYGGIVRLNRRTAERVSIKPVEGKGEPPLRFNWESPFIISPHSPSRLYFGTNRVHRSDDRGNNWTAISGDLTRQIDRNTLPVMGKIWPPEAIAKHQSTDTYGNITSVSESPKQEGLLYAGTDDGLIQVTGDGGKTWRKTEKFPGLPDPAPYGVYVQRIYASKHDANVVYALFDNHKNADFKPYLLRSADKGSSWVSIAGDLPTNGPVLALAEDHVDPNLLFAGTEYGLFFTIDGGKKWISLRGNLPTIPVRDLAIQERENDLILATFGRGFYVLDDYTPLRGLSLETLNRDAMVFPVKKAVRFVPDNGKARGSQGEQLWMSENPVYGAVFTYWLRDSLKTLRQIRLDSAREAEKKKQTPAYPTQAQLTAEADEEEPSVILTITDNSGVVVRRVTGPAVQGIHRVAWNLRQPSAVMGAARPPLAEAMAGGRNIDGGPLVSPGTYKVSLATRVNGVTSQIGNVQTFSVEDDLGASGPTPANRDFQTNVSRLQRVITGAVEAATAARTRLAAEKRAIVDSSADVKLLDEATSLDKKILTSLRRIRGDETLRGQESGTPSSIQYRINAASQVIRSGFGLPTGTQLENYRIAEDEFREEYRKLKALLDIDLKKFEQKLDAAGVPHTPGRMAEWK